MPRKPPPTPKDRTTDPHFSRQAFAARIRQIAARFRSVRQCALTAGVSPTALQSWLDESATPSRENLIAMADVGQVSITWLATGDGPMQRPALATLPPGENVIPFPGADATEQPEPSTSATELAVLPTMHGAPVLAFPPAWLATLGPLDAFSLLAMIGDAMEPTIRHGDLVMLNTQQTQFGSGMLAAVAVGEVVMVRRVQLVAVDVIQLVSENRVYPPQTFDIAQDQARLVGQVVWVGHRLV